MQSSNNILNKRPPLPSIISERSVTDFNRQGELISNDGQVRGFTAVMSFAVWTKMPTSFIYGQQVLYANRGAANEFSIRTEFNGSTVEPKHIEIRRYDSSQTLRQRIVWHNVLTAGTNDWHHYVHTWNGEVGGSKLYVDGSLVSIGSSINDLDGSTVTDTSRSTIIGGEQTGLGNTWTGPIYSTAQYDVELTAAEVAYMYNKGNATTLDLETNFGSYQSAGSLQHYYRLGIGTSDDDFGEDRGVASILNDCTNVNITEGFLTEDVPTTSVPTISPYTGYRTTNISYLQKNSSALSISDEHTMMVWVRRYGTFYSRAIIDSAEGDDVSNLRQLYHNDSNMLTYALRNSAGSAVGADILEYQIEDLPNSGIAADWEQFAFVYDGTNAGDNDLFIYRNAIELTTGAGSGIGDPYLIKTNDGNPNQTDTAVNFTVGSPTDAGFGSRWDGSIWQVAIWDSVLSASEITATYASGSPALLDLGSNFGDYASGANLVHWWKFGDESDRGADYGSAPLNILDDADASPQYDENGNQTWWSLAEYPGSPGNTTTG